MPNKYDYAVFIGRFSPFHIGHLKIVHEALSQAVKIIIVTGSDNRPRNTRNPFTFLERKELIISVLTDYSVDMNRVIITSCEDYLYNDPKWIGGVQTAVNNSILMDGGWSDYPKKIALAGMMKDATSYYINIFPQWDNIAITPLKGIDEDILSATGIRNKIFNGQMDHDEQLQAIMARNPEEWARLRADWNYEQKYEAVYSKGPHVTVDACVIQAGHILLVQRGKEYGKGLYALPGGFLNRREKIEDGVIRELREETKIKVPERVLRGSITDRVVFDDPFRSNRSHIITHAFKIELENVSAGLPKVIGSDDAMKAKWYSFADVARMKHKLFEDHYDMISEMVGM